MNKPSSPVLTSHVDSPNTNVGANFIGNFLLEAIGYDKNVDHRGASSLLA